MRRFKFLIPAAFFIQVGTNAWVKLDSVLAIRSSQFLSKGSAGECKSVVLVSTTMDVKDICSDWPVPKIIETLTPFIQRTGMFEDAAKKEKKK